MNAMHFIESQIRVCNGHKYVYPIVAPNYAKIKPLMLKDATKAMHNHASFPGSHGPPQSYVTNPSIELSTTTNGRIDTSANDITLISCIYHCLSIGKHRFRVHSAPHIRLASACLGHCTGM